MPDSDPVPTEALHVRAGLPLDLLVLHDEWPRVQWPTLPLHPMAAHWLEVHGWFRALIAAAADDLSALREKRAEPVHGMRIARQRLGAFLTNLHHHHHAESSMAFPQLAVLDARLARGFALLDRDHTAIEPLLAALAKAAGNVELDAITQAVEKLMPLLERHLLDEEDLVVPVLSTFRPTGW